MPFSNEIRAGASGAQSTEFYSHTIDQSLRIDNASGAYLTNTIASPTATNRKKVAISCWVKRSGISKSGVCTVFWGTVNGLMLQFFTADSIYIYDNNAGGYQAYVQPLSGVSRLFRDTSAWYHLALIIDTTQSTAADRSKFYVNGTLNAQNSYPSENSDITWHDGSTMRIGSVGDSQDLNGYIAEFISIDGQDVSISDFGETKDGIWVPKDVSGLTLGNAGFYLDFSDSNYIGKSVGSKTLVTSPSFSTFGGGDTNFTQANYDRAFNNKVLDSSCDRTGSGGIIEITPSSAVIPTSHTMINAASAAYTAASRPNSVLLQGSNDGGDNWTTIDDLTNGSGANAATTSTFSNTTSYAKLRLNISETHGGSNTRFGEYIVMASDNNGDGDIIFFNNGNLDSTDIIPDTPSNNFAILNELFLGNSAVIKDGGLEVEPGGFSSSLYGTVSTFAIPKDKKIYIEAQCNDQAGNYWTAGFATNTSLINGPSSNNIGSSGSIMAYNRSVFVNGTETDYGSSYGLGGLGSGVTRLSAGDVLGCMIDGATGKVWFSRNGTYFQSPSTDNSGSTGDPDGGNNEIGTLTGGTTDDVFFVVSGDGGANDVFVNFGQDSQNVSSANADANSIGTFEYAPPTNYVSLCASNLTTPDIGPTKSQQSDDNFSTVLYAGDGASSNSITGVGFKPDWLWIKNRLRSSISHVLVDSVRGLGDNGVNLNTLSSNNSNGEFNQSDADGVSSLNSDGFTVGYNNSNAFNQSTDSYVAWNWKAGGTAVSNSNGSITSSVSANPDAGFSIVSYTGDGTGTVGHGLGKVPKSYWVKCRSNDATNWRVYHSGVASDPETDYLTLDTTAAAADQTFWNDTAPTSDVFSVFNFDDTGTASRTYIAYVFAEVEGFSKIGTYKGGGSSLPFIHTGFSPAWVLLKVSSTTNNWFIFDNKREGFNEENDTLSPNEDAVEDNTYHLDFVSNGFKIRSTQNAHNQSGQTFVYIAFAEAPQKFANAR